MDDIDVVAAAAKRRLALRYWLLGRGWFAAAEALTVAERYHRGLRKDGVTPEVAHPISVASYVRTLEAGLRHPQESVTVALLHDVREDYDVSDAEIRERFGDLVADGVDSMTKVFRGQRRDDVAVFERIATNPVSSVCKAADRINNHDSMVGVFSPEKMASYAAETKQLFLPMLKTARRAFPDQEAAYENATGILTSQLRLVEALLATSS